MKVGVQLGVQLGVEDGVVEGRGTSHALTVMPSGSPDRWSCGGQGSPCRAGQGEAGRAGQGRAGLTLVN